MSSMIPILSVNYSDIDVACSGKWHPQQDLNLHHSGLEAETLPIELYGCKVNRSIRRGEFMIERKVVDREGSAPSSSHCKCDVLSSVTNDPKVNCQFGGQSQEPGRTPG